MTNPTDRRQLAAALRAMRADAGLSTTELARQLGWSQSRVSRIERGATLPKPDQVDTWTRHLRADPNHRRSLMASSESLAIQLTEWKRELAPGRRRVQQEIAELEAAASVVRVFSADVVPGLVQTAPYVEAMFRMSREPLPSQDLAEAVEARMERQTTLDSTGTRVDLLMGETAIHRRLLPTGQMRDQIERLALIAETGPIQLGMIPFTATEAVHQYHSFAALGDPDIDESAVVLVETVTRGLTIRTEDEVRDYARYFAELSTAAIYGSELATYLREVSADAPRS